jgi:hypothetical protein
MREEMSGKKITVVSILAALPVEAFPPELDFSFV